MKATAIAPSNIAFIKYWGKTDEALRLPANGSISMNLSELQTTTTVKFNKDLNEDTVFIDGQKTEGLKKNRVTQHLDRIRKMAKINLGAKIVSQNNFPMGGGLSSSASAFAALTLAGATAAGLDLTEKELSILARQASGSACRSVPDGFVEWLGGKTNEDSYAVSLYLPDYWEICDVVVIVNTSEKSVITTEAQKLAFSSPFFRERLNRINDKISLLKKYLREKDFPKFGTLVENEAMEMHAIIMTSKPSYLYWLPETARLMLLVRKWRKDGLAVYFTLNTGHDLHLLCLQKEVEKVVRLLKATGKVKNVIINRPSVGVRLVERHLL